MLWVLKKAVSSRRFFWAPKTKFNVITVGQENIHNFTVIFFLLSGLTVIQQDNCVYNCSDTDKKNSSILACSSAGWFEHDLVTSFLEIRPIYDILIFKILASLCWC